MTGRLVTPTGRLVTSADPGSDAWHLARAGGITATDIAKLLGVSDQYGTALDVWSVKTGRVQPEDISDREAVRWGHLLEDVVAREGARRDSISVRRVGVLAHREHDWRRASLDRLCSGCPVGKRGAVEVKTRGARVAHAWRDDVPDDVLAQVVWQMHVSGVDHVHVYVLLGGQKLDRHVIKRAETHAVEAFAVEAAVDMWGHIQRDERPHVDPTPGLVESLNRLFAQREGAAEVNDPGVHASLDGYLVAAADSREADQRKRAHQAALMQWLAGRSEGVDPETGRRLFSISATPVVDDDAAWAAHDLWLEAAAQGYVAPAVDITAIRDEDPELYERFRAAGLVTFSQRFNPPRGTRA